MINKKKVYYTYSNICGFNQVMLLFKSGQVHGRVLVMILVAVWSSKIAQLFIIFDQSRLKIGQTLI